MENFSGKVVLVTGGGAGMGAVIAEFFSQRGAVVHVFDVTENEHSNASHTIHTVDVASSVDVQKAISSIVEDLGRLDILVNCAGVMRRASILDTSEADWDNVVGVNLKGAFLVSKFALPAMIRSGWGRIINISSGGGLLGGEKAAAYCAAKGGLILLTKAMSVDHGKQGITVNCICPGDTNTSMLNQEAYELGVQVESFMEGAANRPVGRVGQPEDVASAVLFLASEASSFITGVALPVDGGGTAGF